MYRKLIAAALTLVMILCTCSPAFAEEGSSTSGLPEASDAVSVSEEETGSGDSSSANADTEEVSSPAEPEETEPPEEVKEDGGAEEPEEAPKETAAEKAARLKAEKYKKGLAAYIRKINPNLSKQWSLSLAQLFIDAGEKYNLDPKILMALAQRESGFRSKVTSPYGYKGMMQTSDTLARKYGYKPSSLYKAKVSIDVAAHYLRNLKKEFGTYTKALSGYVYGGYAVKKGCYSKSAAYSMLKTRREIKAYLEKYNYI